MNSKPYFDKDWYLKAYPDVAAADIDPRQHFEKFGRKEGRLPCKLPALALETDLWHNAFSPSQSLLKLQEQASLTNTNAAYANKVLCSYNLFKKDYEKAWEHANKILSLFKLARKLFYEEELFLVIFVSALSSGNEHIAKGLIDQKDWPESISKKLAASMLASESRKQAILNKIFSEARLSTINLEGKGANTFDKINSNSCSSIHPIYSPFKWFHKRKLVSIIIPAFNCEKTIETAVTSILEQSWQKIEIIIVNDCSTDNTGQVINKLRAKSPNIHVITNSRNLGAYDTRNIGVEAASGEFVTVMDADDWAHPQKIEKQLIPLLVKPFLVATVSHWVRCDKNLNFTSTRYYNGWVHRNVSSLLIKKKVVQKLGGWDNVRINADTEFYERVLCIYGNTSIKEVLPGVPLSFGRTVESSLTHKSTTHLVTQYGGLRKIYMDYARLWHKNSCKLTLNKSDKARPFPVPPQILSQRSRNHQINNKTEFHRWQNALDEHWYKLAYDDVYSRGLGLHEHFWGSGEKEGRAPSPLFCPNAYHTKNSLNYLISPTWHALINDWDFNKPVEVFGEQKLSTNAIHVALFGHMVSPTAFGAERSLLDMARACANTGMKVTAFLPTYENEDYISHLLKYVASVVFLPLLWVRGERELNVKQVTYLKTLFLERSINLAYVNTITLAEPYEAAKLVRIPIVTHIRELPEYDNTLADLLAEKPEDSRQRLLRTSDYFIANSLETQNWIKSIERTELIYNCVDNYPHISTPVGIGKKLRVCMISSNIKKKGVNDFFEVANLCRDNADISFTLFGPVTAEVNASVRRFGINNVRIEGYVDDPYKAISDNDVVLALSTFKESFGRTVAEAMIMGRVVVGYKWGAVQELVTENTGILVNFKDTEQVCSALRRLCDDRSSLKLFGSRAQLKASELFSSDSFDTSLSNALQSFIRRAKLEENEKAYN
ncbi:hypothetical protein BM523_16050 [Alteromonas mediterranea]|uniref:glycosyltransferase n=1 Tax=Alteromonas mediterranea TaxID=314275 RepID=UPI000903E653|nr:glycosyltransferase [Alteromonas mediterranea]APD95382.1 hypothetical protein BM523_16050 [Alteromonas mediterranea]APD99015.1 hypothetical protein BM525_16070 [Alteromonas mediterranea]